MKKRTNVKKTTADKQNGKSLANQDKENRFWKYFPVIVKSIVIFFFSPLWLPLIILPLYFVFSLWAAVALFVFLSTASLLIIWLVPIKQVEFLKTVEISESQSQFEKERDILKITDDLRKTMAQIIGGVFFASSLGVAYYTYEVTKERMIYERYTENVKLLKKDNDRSIRIGGLYDLEYIAKTSSELHPAIMNVLINYVKEQSLEITKFEENPITKKRSRTCEIIEGRNNSDIILAVQIINKRNTQYDTSDFSIDFSNVMLNGGNFTNLTFNKITSWENSCLVNADFSNAKINAYFLKSSVYDQKIVTNFTNTQFAGTIIKNTVLDDADLTNALNLTPNQILSGPYINQKTKFYNPDLQINSNLQKAKEDRLKAIDIETKRTSAK